MQGGGSDCGKRGRMEERIGVHAAVDIEHLIVLHQLEGHPLWKDRSAQLNVFIPKNGKQITGIGTGYYQTTDRKSTRLNSSHRT